MIRELAMLQVKEESQKQFEADFKMASVYIISIKGYIRHSLNKCLEKNEQYALIVEWETLEDHTKGFRESMEYKNWKNLLHHYYDPFPEVLHYQPIYENQSGASSIED